MSIINSTAIPNGAKAFEIDQSLRFNQGDDTNLSKTFASAGNRRTWSFSVWFKRGNTGGTNNTTNKDVFFGGINDGNMVRIADDQLQFYVWDGSADYGWISAAFVRDVSAWYHALFVFDTTSSTAAHRQRIYLNGVELTDKATDYGIPAQNYDGAINTAGLHTIGKAAGANEQFDGYLAEVNFIDGAAKVPTDFGETGNYGEWKPIEYEGTYGNNGFYLPFKQDYTVEGFSAVVYRGAGVTGQTNYIGGVGFNPDLVWIKSRGTGSDPHQLYDSVRGVTKSLKSDATDAELARSTGLTAFNTDGFTMGKHVYNNRNTSPYVAWNWDMGTTTNPKHQISVVGNVKHSTTQNKIGATSILFDGTGDRLDIPASNLMESAEGTIECWVYMNALVDGSQVYYNPPIYNKGNVYQALTVRANGKVTSHLFTGATNELISTNAISTGAWTHIALTWNSSGRKLWINGVLNGSSDISLTSMDAGGQNQTFHIGEGVNSSSVSLNAYVDELRVSKIVRYTGNFTPYESARGEDNDTQFLLHSNADNNSTLFVDSSDGGDVNNNGSIESIVAANPTYGQSIVSYTGNNVAGATIGHGLSSQPDMIIVKKRAGGSAYNWGVWHTGLSNNNGTKQLWLNTADSEKSEDMFNNGPIFPSNSSTVFAVGQNNHTNYPSGATYIAYCFHDVSGYSKFSSYTGTGSTHAVTLGFAPAFIMIKCTNVAHPWVMLGNTRQAGTALKYEIYANTTAAEGTDASGVLFTSTGFQLTTDNSYVNQNTKTFIYMAFADKREYAYWLDQSGNNNDWTSNNLTESDIMVDSPTNNFATLNPLDKSGTVTLSEGNLKYVNNTGVVRGTLAAGAGSKFYLEYCQVSAIGGSGPIILGIGTTEDKPAHESAHVQSMVVHCDGNSQKNVRVFVNKSQAQTTAFNALTAINTGGILMFAYDGTTGKAWVGINGSWLQGNPATGANPIYTFSNTDSRPMTAFIDHAGVAHTGIINFGQDSSFAGFKTAQGNQDSGGVGDFFYTPPSSFKALCTQNLPDVAVVPSEHFNTVIYTGTGSSNTQNANGITGGVDFLWTKCRSHAKDHILANDVIGGNTNLSTNAYGVENTASNRSITLGNSSFTLNSNSGHLNEANKTYVSWMWKADTTPSKTYAVTVVSDSGNKYRFDGFGASAVTLDLQEGGTYKFDQSHSSNSSHPFRFGTSSNAYNYSTGVTTSGTPGNAGAYTQITVAASAPALYYACSSHSGMGGAVNTNSTAGSSDFKGTIQSKNSANVDAGFSIISYSGNNTAGATVGHGLSKAPEMIIFKSRTNSNDWWDTYHKAIGANNSLFMNSTIRAVDRSYYHDTHPSSTVISLGAERSSNGPSETFIAYAFHSVDGYSKTGEYKGNSSADGSYVFLGFRPAFVLIKRTDSDGQGSPIFDSARDEYNMTVKRLRSDSNASELNTDGQLDLLSNGFKLRNTDGSTNNSSGTYIYLAFAETPAKYSNAR